MTRKRSLNVLAFLTLATACGGRSVDVDGGRTGSTADAPSGTSPKVVLSEHIYQYWVDATRLYWQTYMGGLHGCLKSDCSHTRVSYGTPWQYSLGIGSNDVYWIPYPATESVIYACPKTGCSGAPRTVLHDANGVGESVAADGDFFYWASAFDIYRCPSAGCAATPEVVAAYDRPMDLPLTLTFQGDYVYWAEPATSDAGNAGAAGSSANSDSIRGIPGVFYAPKDGSAPTQELLFRDSSAPTRTVNPGPGGHGAGSFALSSQRVYWIDLSWRILSCPLEGCPDSGSDEVVGAKPYRNSLSVDEVGLYWLEADEEAGCFHGSVHFCAFADCGSSDVTLLPRVYDYVLNGSDLYFTESSDDTCYPTGIRRIAKPVQ